MPCIDIISAPRSLIHTSNWIPCRRDWAFDFTDDCRYYLTCSYGIASSDVQHIRSSVIRQLAYRLP